MKMKTDAGTIPHGRHASVQKTTVERLPFQDRLDFSLGCNSEVERAVPNDLDRCLLIQSEIVHHRNCSNTLANETWRLGEEKRSRLLRAVAQLSQKERVVYPEAFRG